MADVREVKAWDVSGAVVLAAAINVSTGAGSVLELDLDGRFNKVLLEVENTHASVAFDVFVIAVQLVKDGEWTTYLATGTTWATTSSLILFGAGTISTLAINAFGELILQVNGVQGLRVMISGNAAASEASVKAFALQE